MTRLWNPHKDYPIVLCPKCGSDAYLVDGTWQCDRCGVEWEPERYEPESYTD